VIEGEEVMAFVELAEGTTSERTREIASYLEQMGYEAVAELEATQAEDQPPLVEAESTGTGAQP